MSSTIPLIIVVCCCLYAYAVPHHGRSASEIDQYDSDDDLDSQYSIDDQQDEPVNVDVSLIKSPESAVKRYNRRYGHRHHLQGHPPKSLHRQKYRSPLRSNRRKIPKTYQSSRRATSKNVRHYNENINIHDNRDIWGEFDPPKSQSYAKGGDSSDTSDDYSDESKDANSNQNINSFHVTDKPKLPGYSDSPKDIDLPDLIEQLKEDLKPAAPSKSPETLHKSSLKIPTVPPKAPEDAPKVFEEPPKAQTKFPTVPSKPGPKKPEEKFKCTNGPLKEDPRYSMIFPSTIFSSKPIHTESVHTGGDLTLCWIETVTIKEDNFTKPVKRLVMRDYAITFENSVLIPDEYLECPRIDGEIHPITKEDLTDTSFQEYFTDDTKKSKVTILKKVNRDGNLTVTEEKTIRCGIGSRITKHVYEWLDVPDKPVRRVEIQVGPDLKPAKNDSEKPTTTTALPDEVAAITVDCFIDGTCSTPANTITSAQPSDDKGSISNSSEGSCDSGDENCVEPDDNSAVGQVDKEDSQEIELPASPLFSEDLVEGMTIASSATETTSIPEILSTEPSELENQTVTITTAVSATSEEPQTEEISTTPQVSQELDVTTPTQPTTTEEEIQSTENMTATTATRRTTFSETPSTEVHRPRKPRYALKLRVILERIDDNDKRETVVNLQKEMPLNHKNRTYMDQLDAFNESISNIAVMRDLLKCSAFEGISPIIWGYVGSSSEEEEEDVTNRRKRSIPVVSSKNASLTDDDVVDQCLPDIREDIETGLNELKSGISDNNVEDILTKGVDVLPTKASNFEKGNSQASRTRRSVGVGESGAISQWSHERFRDSSDGGQIRSFTELVIVEDIDVV